MYNSTIGSIEYIVVTATVYLFLFCCRKYCMFVKKNVDGPIDAFKEAYLQELARSAYSCIAKVHSVVINNDETSAIVMDKIDGMTLSKTIRHNKGYRHYLEYIRLWQLALQAINNVGIVHGDIHTSNAMIGADDKFYLIDFGNSNYCSSSNNLIDELYGADIEVNQEIISMFISKHIHHLDNEDIAWWNCHCGEFETTYKQLYEYMNPEIYERDYLPWPGRQ
jgi:tRNA A-37 threonylcarbamoyl transferase component Bud32